MSSMLQSAGPTDTMEGLDAQIDELHDKLSVLKRRRNFLLPISRLPAELLCQIFALCVPSFPRRQSPNFRRRRPWLSFSTTCHWWRTVAVSFPSLWTRPWFKRPNLAAIMLQRSQPLPIHIMRACISGQRDADSAVLSAFADACRVQTLELTEDRSLLLPKLARPFPILESFSIHGRRDFNGDEPLITTLFQNDVPRLLKFKSFPLSWHAPILQNLLILEVSEHTNLDRTTWVDFADALKGMTRLQRLRLENALPRTVAFRGLGEHSIVLPNLRHLDVVDREDCATIFVYLVFLSPGLLLSLTFKRHRPSENLPAIGPILQEFLRTTDTDSTMRCLHMSRTSSRDRYMSFCLRTSVESSSDSKLSLVFDYSKDLWDMLDGDSIPAWTQYIHSLMVEGYVSFIEARWGLIFSALKNLQQICLMLTFDSFVQKLSSNASAASRKEELVLPLLLQFAFRDHVSKYDMATLSKTLKTRGEFGVRLRELRGPSEFLELLPRPMDGVDSLVCDEFVMEPEYESTSDDEF